MKLTLMFYNGTRSLLILRSNYLFKITNRFKKRIWFPQRCVLCIHISGFLSMTSVSLDKLYQGSKNFSEQKFRFPWHQMKFTINWLFCPYRSNQHRSWTVFHSHLSYWWTVIISNWKNGKNTHNTTKNKVHIVYFFKLVICPVVRVSIRIFNLTSQIYIEWCRLCCFMGYLEIASWCGFPLYWRPWGDFVDRRFLERRFGINQIYFFSMNLRSLQNTQRSRKVVSFFIWNPVYFFLS
jgi:hypothetical protein